MVNSVDSKEKKLEKWRQKIDALDIKIQNDLNQRARYALEIGKIKRAHQMPIYCPQREKDVIRNTLSHNSGPLSDQALKRLYERIIDESRRLEREETLKLRREKSGNASE
jgi:chorismate mutase